MSLQAAVEEITGSTLDLIAAEKVFKPLGMKRSFFGSAHEENIDFAYGHVSYGRTIAPFAITFIPALSVLMIIAVLISRIALRRWGLTKTTFSIVILAALATSIWFMLYKGAPLLLAAYFTACALAIIFVWLTICGIVYCAVRRLCSFRKLSRGLQFLAMLLMPVLLVLMFFPLRNLSVPIPLWFKSGGNAASSLRSTAGDLARFLVELSQSQHLDLRLTEQMLLPQVRVNDDISWGLGLAIQHSPNGPSIWHWGSNPGSKSIMVIYPDRGLGVVVLSNSGNSSDLIVEIAGRALGGRAVWDF
jgi:CubicO group peptidase (beta-lactamase class C family)